MRDANDARRDDVKRTVCGKMTIYGEAEPMDDRFFRVHGGVEGSRCALATARENSYDPRSRVDRRFLSRTQRFGGAGSAMASSRAADG
jgi:hypothetical protein